MRFSVASETYSRSLNSLLFAMGISNFSILIFHAMEMITFFPTSFLAVVT